jgi:hypothetical protein
MPFVTIKTGFSTDDREEILTEYVCDWPGCPNIAVHSLGCITAIRAMAIVCEDHTPRSKSRTAR